jgi:hypothetical protein
MGRQTGQSGIEMAAFTGFLIMILIVFTYMAQERQNDVLRERGYVEAQRIASLVAAQVNTAASIGDGFSSGFLLPPSVYGENYTISIVPAQQRVEVSFGASSLAASAQILTSNVSANFNVGGQNQIANNGGVIRIG